MGDGVPAHLFTREALQTYQARLRARDGLLVVHASLRYSRLYPIFAATAGSVGLESLEVVTDVTNYRADSDWDPTRSIYLLAGSAAH